MIRRKRDASRAETSHLVIPAPEGLDYLPFQKAGIEYMINKENHPSGGILLSDEMGLLAKLSKQSDLQMRSLISYKFLSSVLRR